MQKALITVPGSMSDETYEMLCAGLTKRMGGGLTFERRTDDSVIGGFVLSMDGAVYDLSISTQLSKLKKHLISE